MKQLNRYDNLIDKLTFEFSQIKNFHLTQENGKGKKIFDFIIKRIAEIHSFKSLFSHYYLPAASKYVADDITELNKSKYKHLIQISREELKENYYETIRLAYIGMFHKYENYLDDLIIHAELLTSQPEEKGQPLTKYVEKEFHYKIKDWKNSPTINRINWISNCDKHYDGYPRKLPKYESYLHLSNDAKMKFTKEDFISDIQLLISHYSLSLQTVFFFAIHKMSWEGKTFEVNEFHRYEITSRVT